MNIKSSALLIACLFCTQAFAQGGYDYQVELIDKVYKLYGDYKSSAELRDPGDEKVSEAQVQKFIALFDPNARIFDDLCPEEIHATPYVFIEKAIPKYIESVKKLYPGGLQILVTNANISFDSIGTKNPANREVRIVMARTVAAEFSEKGASYAFTGKDTLLLHLRVNSDFTDVKIAEIEVLGHHLSCYPCPKCLNDLDCDGVTDANDKCPLEAGKAEFQGCPAAPSAKATKGAGGMVFGVTVGLSFPFNKVKLPEPNFTSQNYPGFNDSESTYDNYKTKAASGGVSLELGIDMFFNKEKKYGIGTGLMFNFNSTQLTADSVLLVYGDKDGEGISYTRHLAVRSVEEKVMSTSFGLPLLFKIRGGSGEKMGWFIDGGPLFIFTSSLKSKSSKAQVDHLALYNDWNLFLDTDGEIAYHVGHHSEQYDLGFNKDVEGSSTKIKFGGGGGFLLRGGLAFKLSESFSLLTGLNLAVYKMKNNKESDEPLVDEAGRYNSLLYGVDSHTVTMFGFNLGAQITF